MVGKAKLVLLGTVAILLAPHRGARAERVGTIIYHQDRQPESQERIAASLQDLLSAVEQEQVDVFALAADAVRRGAVPINALDGFARTQQLVDEGWRSYLEVRAGFAAARLAAARTEALNVAALAGGQRLLAEVSLRLGVAKVALGRAAEAADDFRLAHALHVDREINDSEFRPDVVAAFQAAIAQPRERQSRPLQMSPASAQLSIDGVLVPSGTLDLEDGLHLLSAKALGFHSESKLISVTPGVDAKISFRLIEDPLLAAVLRGPAALALGVPESEARRAAGALSLYAATDSLLLVASVWRQGQPALLGQMCAGQPSSCTSVLEVGYPEGGLRVAMDQLWRNLMVANHRFPPTLQVDARLISGEHAPGVKTASTSEPLWKKEWLWLGVAGASLAAGAWLVLGADDELKPIVTGQRCDFGGC